MQEHKLPNGWVGVDLDGTLAHVDDTKPFDPAVIGAPITPCVDAVKELIRMGVEVRIVTARAAGEYTVDAGGPPLMNLKAVQLIQDWCEKHIGKRLTVQFWKDYAMNELWDDRAVQMMKNTGVPALVQAQRALHVAELMYSFARKHNWQVPRAAWDDLRNGLGIPKQQESLIVTVGNVLAHRD
jgi:hypothetical protein